MSDIVERKSLSGALERIQMDYAIEGDDGDVMEYAALALDTNRRSITRLRKRVEALEGALEGDLLSLLKGEHSSLTIGFNEEHACNYLTAQQYSDQLGDYGGGSENQRIHWVSEDERLLALQHNTVWTCQWYPLTPVGFNCIGASSLSALIKALQPNGEAE